MDCIVCVYFMSYVRRISETVLACDSANISFGIYLYAYA